MNLKRMAQLRTGLLNMTFTNFYLFVCRRLKSEKGVALHRFQSWFKKCKKISFSNFFNRFLKFWNEKRFWKLSFEAINIKWKEKLISKTVVRRNKSISALSFHHEKSLGLKGMAGCHGIFVFALPPYNLFLHH